MPRLSIKVWIVEQNNSHNLLRRDDSNPSADGNPGEHIRNSTGVALVPVSVCKSQEIWIENYTITRLARLGAKMEVQ